MRRMLMVAAFIGVSCSPSCSRGIFTKTSSITELHDVQCVGAAIVCVFKRETFTDSIIGESMQHGTHLSGGPDRFLVARFPITSRTPARAERVWNLGEFPSKQETTFELVSTNLALLRFFSETQTRRFAVQYVNLDMKNRPTFGATLTLRPLGARYKFPTVVSVGPNGGLFNESNRILEVRFPNFDTNAESVPAKLVETFIESGRPEPGTVPGVLAGDMDYFVGFDKGGKTNWIVDLKRGRPMKQIGLQGVLADTSVQAANVLDGKLLLLLWRFAPRRHEWIVYDVEAEAVLSKITGSILFKCWTIGDRRIVFESDDRAREKQNKKMVKLNIWDWRRNTSLSLELQTPEWK
jgi:hypothetical protein